MLNQKFWKNYFKAYDTLNSAIPYQDLLNDITREVKAEKNDLILDAGSGTGNLMIKLKKINAKLIGFDFCKEAIKLHKKKDKKAVVVFGNLENKLPFQNNYFDKIVSNNVIYTLNKELRLKIFQEFYRVLKFDGIIVVSNINENFKPLIIFLDHFKKSLKKFGFIKTFIDLATMGFAVIKIFYYNFLIKKENKQGDYNFVKKDEQFLLLKKAGFKNIIQTKLTYSNQSYLNAGKKI